MRGQMHSSVKIHVTWASTSDNVDAYDSSLFGMESRMEASANRMYGKHLPSSTLT